MTPIYDKIIDHAKAKGDEDALALAHKVWDDTPWVIDVWLGEPDDVGEYAYERNINCWCNQYVGKQAWPIHGKTGKWYRAGFSVNGWTWIGFDTQGHMSDFMDAWPENIKSAEAA